MTRYRFTCQLLADRHALIKLSQRIACITQCLKRPGKNGRRAKVVAAYFGFSSQSEAIGFVNELKQYAPSCFCQIRQATRLDCPIEVKIREFAGIEEFIAMKLRQVPTTSQRIASHLQALPTIRPAAQPAPDRHSAKSMSRSRGATVRSGEYLLSIE